MEINKKDKRKVKRCIYQCINEVNEQLGRKMNQNVDANRKLFWRKVSEVKGGKVKSCSRIKDGNGTLALEEDEVRMIWKGYFDDLYNIDTK